MSIRVKLIFFISVIIFIIDALSCMSFFFYSKRRYSEDLENFGETLSKLFTSDNEIKYALDCGQPLFFDSPVRRLREFDRENIVSYIRISNDRNMADARQRSPSLCVGRLQQTRDRILRRRLQWAFVGLARVLGLVHHAPRERPAAALPAAELVSSCSRTQSLSKTRA